MAEAPALAPGVRLGHDRVRDARVLLGPETIVRLDPIAAEVLALVDGARDAAAIVDALEARYGADPRIGPDVEELLARLASRGLVTGPAPATAARAAGPPPLDEPSPEVLLLELTHRCPLGCPYCSNPRALVARSEERRPEELARAIEEATALGALQVHFSGGEPLLHEGLPSLIEAARRGGAYTNLVTSAWGLDEARLDALAGAGLEHVQVSVQHVDAEAADAIARAPAHARKLAAMDAIVRRGLALSLNVVLHRESIDRVEDFVALAERVGACRLELANLQRHGLGAANHAALSVDDGAYEAARAAASAARARLRGRLDVIFVPREGATETPKACMGGWGRRYLVIAPDGRVLPCPGASELPLPFDRLGDAPLAELFDGEAFRAYRGTGWMQEPCASCPHRARDLGGCRCQAFRVLGDLAATDPACPKSPAHARFVEPARALPVLVPRGER